MLDGRLYKRYLQLVAGQMNAAQQVAAGIKALPGPSRAFAATQGGVAVLCQSARDAAEAGRAGAGGRGRESFRVCALGA